MKVVTAVREFSRRGLTMLRAKRTIEAVLVSESVLVHLPAIEEDRDILVAALEAAGVAVRYLSQAAVDVRALRDGLDLTREQFALRFNIPLDTVEKWEAGERQPDAGSLAYLRVIASSPETAMRAQVLAAE